MAEVRTQDGGAAGALEMKMGEPARVAEHAAKVNGELSRSLENAAALQAVQNRTAARGRAAAEDSAIRRYELLR